MFIDVVPNRGSPPAILLRKSVREGGKVRKITLANLSAWPPVQVALLRRVLRGEPLVPPEEAFQIVRTRPHGHVSAVLGTLRRLDLEHLIASKPSRQRDLVVAMITARLLEPRSKLATAQGLDPDTLHSTLGEVLGLTTADADELYQAMDWLLARQARIEAQLAARHLREGTLVLYDVTSVPFTGRTCTLAQWGQARDRRKAAWQIVFGLLCNAEGRPVAVEVFEGNTADPTTLGAQIEKLQNRFHLQQVVLVGDRGMITEARIREELRPGGLSWITALRAPQIHQLVRDGALQLSLFDERDLAEIAHPDYPGERLIVCYNPLLAGERAAKREALLAATEQALAKIRDATQRSMQRLHGRARIALRVGQVLHRYKVGKHFRLTITDEGVHYERHLPGIAAEAALDGIYVIRTNVPADQLSAVEMVRAYKALSRVERAFRSYKSLDLRVYPIYHRLPPRVRAHVFLCLLAYYVEWHMRQALQPILFDDHDQAAADAQRPSVVAPARRSAQAQRKAQRKQTEDGLPVQSFQTLLKDLATLAKNRVLVGGIPIDVITAPTPLQQRAFDLLGVSHRL